MFSFYHGAYIMVLNATQNVVNRTKSFSNRFYSDFIERNFLYTIRNFGNPNTEVSTDIYKIFIQKENGSSIVILFKI